MLVIFIPGQALLLRFLQQFWYQYKDMLCNGLQQLPFQRLCQSQLHNSKVPVVLGIHLWANQEDAHLDQAMCIPVQCQTMDDFPKMYKLDNSIPCSISTSTQENVISFKSKALVWQFFSRNFCRKCICHDLKLAKNLSHQPFWIGSFHNCEHFCGYDFWFLKHNLHCN